MHILFSPTKQMNFELAALPENAELLFTTPHFSDKARMLNERLKEFSRQDLGKLMKISDALADRSYETVRAFDDHSGTPALFAYSGTSFQALDALSLDRESLSFASHKLSILSGMYGLLYPMDLIAPYRLEMKTALSLKGAKNLTAFWKPLITGELSEKIRKCGDKAVINLASGEYSKAIDNKNLNCQIINFYFKDKSNSGYKIVGMYAKTARGKMLQRILSEKILNPDVLKDKPTYNYEFRSDMSDKDNWVFTRG